MTKCDLHFGDSTAHVTAKWFLDQLRAYDGVLRAYDDVNIFTEDFDRLCKDLNVVNIFTEDFDRLCKDLNVVRFVDCLRKQIGEDKEHFKRLEKIATRLLEEKHDKGRKKFKDYPNLSVLLLSIAQSSLLRHSSVKETKLYQVGDNLYKTFKDGKDHIDLALKVGFQLLKFQDDRDDSDWNFKFSEFKNEHYEKLTVIRRHYFSTDNPSTFSLQAVKRYKLKIDNHSENDNRFKHSYLNNEFRKHDPEEDFLRPLYLQLPILARSTAAMSLADSFAQNSKSNIDFSTDLAKKLRILQWNILGRNLVEEDRKGTLSFHRIKRKDEIQGVPEKDEIQGVPKKSFLIDTLRETRFIECLFSPEEGEIPMQQRAEVSEKELTLLEKNWESVKEAVKECYKSFGDGLLPKVLDLHPRAYEDLVRSFAEIRDKSKTSNAVLIEDGELSFFSILWLLRYAAGKGEAPENWGEYPDEKLSVCFRPTEDKSRDNWWTSHDLYEFAEECGLIICLPNTEKCILTQRWRSLITWLGRINSKLIELTGKDKEQIQVIEERIVKKLADNEGKFFVNKDLREFFASENLKDLLGTLRVFSPLPMECKDFAEKQFGPLVELLGSLLEAESTGLDDMVLLRRCRASFIPLEHLFRAYWPCELHLLIQALDWEESSVKNIGMAPISLGFATIAGKVETDWNLKSDSESSSKSTNDFDHWLVPYRTLFSTLSNNLTLIDVKESSEQIGEQTQKKSFAHQTSGLIGTIYLDPQKENLSFLSQFSLWLAKVHVQEIWGDIPMHPERAIYERDFPHWGKGAIKIVDRLVDLGVWGGLVRAAAPPTISDNTENEPEYPKIDGWNLSVYARHRLRTLDNPNSGVEMINQVIEDELRSLSFRHLFYNKHSSLPEWTTGRAFAICFYHGMRQAVYHALKTFVFVDQTQENPNEPCLWTEWTDKGVLIYNRGVVDIVHPPGFISKDRDFFENFEKKAVTKAGTKMFKTVGPKPDGTGKWCFEINKVTSDK